MRDVKYDQEALLGFALKTNVAFKAAGYVINENGISYLNPPLLDKSGMGVNVSLCAEFEAGGRKDVCIDFRDYGFCRFYVSPGYDVPPGTALSDVKPPPCQFWGGFAMPREDYIGLLLAKVRALVLDNNDPDLTGFD